MEFFSLIAGYLFINNLFLYFLFGWEDYAVEKRTASEVLSRSVVTVIFLFLVTLLLWPLETYFIAPFDLIYLRPLLYLFVIWLLAEGLQVIWLRLPTKNMLCPSVRDLLLNSVLLGGSLLILGRGYGFFETLAAAFASSLGYMMAQGLILQLENRMIKERLPTAFHGFPIQLISAGLIGFSFLGFLQFFPKGS